MITSNEILCASHGCAETYLPVHQIHVVHNIHDEYKVQPTTLHIRIDIVALLRWEVLRPPPKCLLPLFVQIQTCTLVAGLLYRLYMYMHVPNH